MTVPAERQLVVVVPGLLKPLGHPSGARFPALERLVARSDRFAPGPAGFHAALFELFGAELPAGDQPVAAVTRIHDMGIIDQDWWMRADPVHLIADRDRLILGGPAELALSCAEADALVSELMQTYAPDGWLIKAPRADRWYVRPPSPADIRTVPLAEAVGRDIHPLLPQGPDARAWHTILNEFQILLHTARANADRERGGLPAANSVWFWGSGRLPRVTQCSWAMVWSAEPAARGFAKLCGVPQSDLPATFCAWLDGAGAGCHLLVFDPDAHPELATLEKNWFAPAYLALHAGELARLNMLDDTGARFVITKRNARRWWRRTRPLEAWRPAADSA